MHRRKAQGNGKEKVVLGWTEPFHGQRVKYMIRSSEMNAKPRQCRQGRGKKNLHGLYYRLFFSGSEVVDCAVLRQMNSTARAVLSLRALHEKLHELVKHERKGIEELASRTERLENGAETAKKTNSSFERISRGY